MLVHGFGDRKETWTLFAARFRKTFNLVIPDLPGFGQSSRDPEQKFDMVSQARWLRALLDSLSLGEVYLVGSSMGGWVGGERAATGCFDYECPCFDHCRSTGCRRPLCAVAV